MHLCPITPYIRKKRMKYPLEFHKSGVFLPRNFGRSRPIFGSPNRYFLQHRFTDMNAESSDWKRFIPYSDELSSLYDELDACAEPSIVENIMDILPPIPSMHYCVFAEASQERKKTYLENQLTYPTIPLPELFIGLSFRNMTRLQAIHTECLTLWTNLSQSWAKLESNMMR